MGDTQGTQRLEQKLEILIRLVAMELADHREVLGEKAVLLRRAGIGPKEIAAICGTTPKTISVALAQAKKKGKRHPKAKGRSGGKRR